MNESPKARVGAKDFFLWLGAMVALYVSSISLIILFHQYITFWFPDVALEPYGGFYSGPIRAAIASLIVFFPLYVFLTRLIHQDVRKNPEKKTLWVGRWLTYLTLFVAGVVMAIDLVWVINSFLSGELTTRFLLKAVSILVVVGAAFWYYLNELKGVWERKEGVSKMVGAVAGVVVLVSVIGGFFVIGSPMDERLYRIDEQRVQDLSNIQYQVIYYYQAKQVLPSNIEALQDPLMSFYAPQDPETGASYEYRAVSADTFELCATFAKATREVRGTSRPATPGNESWQHEEGRQCFTRTIDPALYPPLNPKR